MANILRRSYFAEKFALFRLSFTAGAVKCGDLRADDRVILCFLVYLEPVLIFLRDRHIREDRFDRAFRDAGVAVDAGVRVDQEPVRQFVKGFNRTDRGTVGVLTIKTRLSNNIRHGDMGEPAKLSGLGAGMAKLKTYNPANQLSNHWFKVLECLQTPSKNRQK